MKHVFGGIEAGGTKFVCVVGSGPNDILAEARFPTTAPDETLDSVISFFERYRGILVSFGIASFGPLDLDPESEKAKSALIRVKSIISAEEFQQLMSSGFKAFNSNDYNRARSLFLKAQSFKPDSHEVNDALAQVDTSIRLSHIEDLRKKALAAEDAENWEKSLASYQAVLKIDNSIQFAIQGKERSTKRSQLEKRMNYYLEKPDVLESDHNLKKAIELVKKAEKIESKGPRFNEQLKRLDELVKSAQIPVPVTLESDGVTEVVIYKVGKFGSFYIRELNLRPGTYTIVGARDGFKDVRQEISVKTGQGPIRIIVKCGEKI